MPDSSPYSKRANGKTPMNKLTPEMEQYLDDLREIGRVNMFAASAFLSAEFSLEKKEARAILAEWMRLPKFR